jgi:hypothetical protein
VGTNLIGGGILALIVFGILWLFFGATWWVILTSVVIGGMGVMNHSEEGEDSKSLRASLTTGISPFDANSIDGKSARLILASALEQKDFVWENTIEPIATETIRFLANRGNLDDFGPYFFIGSRDFRAEASRLAQDREISEDIKDRIQRAATAGTFLADIDETTMQQWLDLCERPPSAEVFSDIDINQHFAVQISRHWLMKKVAAQAATFQVDFAFSNAFPDFARLEISSWAHRLNDPERLGGLVKELEKAFGKPPEHQSLADKVNEEGPTAIFVYAETKGISYDELDRQADIMSRCYDTVTYKDVSISLHECTEATIEDAVGDGFRRFVRATDFNNQLK